MRLGNKGEYDPVAAELNALTDTLLNFRDATLWSEKTTNCAHVSHVCQLQTQRVVSIMSMQSGAWRFTCMHIPSLAWDPASFVLSSASAAFRTKTPTPPAACAATGTTGTIDRYPCHLPHAVVGFDADYNMTTTTAAPGAMIDAC